MTVNVREILARLEAEQVVDIYFDTFLQYLQKRMREERKLGAFRDTPIEGSKKGQPEGEPVIRINSSWVKGSGMSPAEIEKNLNTILTFMIKAYTMTTTGNLMMVLS